MEDNYQKPVRLIQFHSKVHGGITPVRHGEWKKELADTLESFELDDEPISVKPAGGLSHTSQFSTHSSDLVHTTYSCTKYAARDATGSATFVHVDALRKSLGPVGHDIHTFAFHGNPGLCERLEKELKDAFGNPYTGPGYSTRPINRYLLFVERALGTYRETLEHAGAALCLEIAKGPYMNEENLQKLETLFLREGELFSKIGRLPPDVWNDAKRTFPENTPESAALRIGTFIAGTYLEDLKRAGRFFGRLFLPKEERK